MNSTERVRGMIEGYRRVMANRGGEIGVTLPDLDTVTIGGQMFTADVQTDGDRTIATVHARSIDDIERVKVASEEAQRFFARNEPAPARLQSGNGVREMHAREIHVEQSTDVFAAWPVRMKVVLTEPEQPRPALKPDGVTVQLPGYVDKIELTIGFTDPHAERRAREAPLVALVSQVPEGLDATGWRAAVLAYRETKKSRPVDGTAATVIRALVTDALYVDSPEACAYYRAIALHKAPPPERKGATWRERGTIYTQHADDAD